MPKFSQKSLSNLKTCVPVLQNVAREVVKTFDCSCIEGARSKEKQDKYFNEGLSKLKWPNSKHNTLPLSKAVHLVPYPIDWEDRERFNFFAGYVLGTAKHMGITLRWGGDWNMNWEVRDNVFDDLAHFEVVEIEDFI